MNRNLVIYMWNIKGNLCLFSFEAKIIVTIKKKMLIKTFGKQCEIFDFFLKYQMFGQWETFSHVSLGYCKLRFHITRYFFN